MHLLVHLTPKASHNKIEGWALNAGGHIILRVKVTAVPEDGKANQELIKLLSKALHISKASIVILRGLTSRIKHLDLAIDEKLFTEKLGEAKKK